MKFQNISTPNLLTCLIFAALICFSAQDVTAQNASLKVSNIKQKGIEGCGCGFQLSSEARNNYSQKMIFFSEDNKTALMNIDGKDVKLKLSKAGARPKNEKKGSRFYEEYKTGTTTVRLDYLTTFTCAESSNEDCEAFNYNVTITVTKGNLRKVVKTSGACGC